MVPIVAKREAGSAPIPVIGLESALELDSSEIEDEDKLNRIAVSAYYKAEARGYEPGHEMQDWLDAEAEVMEKTKGEKNK
jgi:hypothetical protein